MKKSPLLPARRCSRRWWPALLAAAGSLCALPALAADDPYDGQWRFSLTPYLWLPSVSGSATFRGPNGGGESLSTSISSSDYLSNLDMAMMLIGEVRKGEWSAFTDYIYLNFGSAKTQVNGVTGIAGNPLGTIDLGSNSSLRGNVWTLAGAYTVWRDRNTSVDVLAGFRYLNLKTTLHWNLAGPLGLLSRAGNVERSEDKWDGIVGVKGEVRFGDGKWFMPYYADVGTGSSNLTWQALLGVGYRFGWGAVTASARSLSYDFRNDKADVRFTGPALSATFTF